MGKIRHVTMGDEQAEKEQKKKAEARRETKKAKKQKVEEVVSEGTDIKPEFKNLVSDDQTGETEEKKVKKQKKTAAPRVRSKRYQEALKLVEKDTLYPLPKAVALTKKTSTTKFDGTIELHINLNPLSLGEKTDLRGSVSLPHGTGKEVRVAIADDALVAQVEKGIIEFDVLVAHPSMMGKLAKVARTLGPKGLMPNPKTGTVSETPEKRAKELSQGQVNFKTEPANPIIHMRVGKVSFEDKKLEENVKAVLVAVGVNKIARVTLSSSMGPGVKVALT